MRRLLLSMALLVALTTDAAAQATRTWVSGVGDDVNPCSRTAPCKTFAGAISKTTASGEIDALDPGGFGSVTIGKALTIDGSDGQGYVTVGIGSSGIIIDAAATDVVIVRNLSISCMGSGANGILFNSGKALYLEHVTIRGCTQAGVSFSPSAASDLVLVDVDIFDIDNAGIMIQPETGGAAHVLLQDLFVQGSNEGIAVGSGAQVTVSDTTIGQSTGPGVAVTVPAEGSAEVNLDTVSLQGNDVGIEVSAAGGTATVRTFDVTITDSTTALVQKTGNVKVLSFGNSAIPTGSLGACAVTPVPLSAVSFDGAKVGSVYGQALDFSDLTVQAITGVLPPGLAYVDGDISGTPTSAGSYVVTASGKDGNECPLTRELTIVVAPADAGTTGGSTGGGEVSVGDFTLTVAPTLKLSQTEAASVTLTVTAQDGFAAPVTVTCDAPATVSCVMEQSVVDGSGSVTASLRLVSALTQAPIEAQRGWSLQWALFALPFVWRRRRAGLWALFIVVSTVQCTGGGKTATVTFKASGGGKEHSATISVSQR